MLIKMKSLARKEKQENYPTVSEKETEKITYPEVKLNSKQIDGIKKLRIGDKGMLEVEFEVKESGRGDGSYNNNEKGTIWVNLCLTKGKLEALESKDDE